MAKATTSGGRGRRPAGRPAPEVEGTPPTPTAAAPGPEQGTEPLDTKAEPAELTAATPATPEPVAAAPGPAAEAPAAGHPDPAAEGAAAQPPVAADLQAPPAQSAAPDADAPSPVVAAAPLPDPETPRPSDPWSAPRAEPAAPQPAPAPPPPPARSGGFVPLVLGGIVAAGLGAGAALWFMPNGPRGPGGGPGAFNPSDLEERLTALESAAPPDLSPLDARLSALEQRPQGSAAPADLSDLVARVTALEARLAEPAPAVPDLSALETRLAALESRPAPEPAPAPDLSPLADRIAALETALPGMIAQGLAEATDRLQDRAAEVEASAADIAAARARAEALAALGALGLALDQGTPAPEALALVTAALDPAPEGLEALSQGVPTLGALLAGWPAAARAALAAAPPTEGAGGIADFLRRQTGARSLAPREGSDTDAILSRAEAALRAGDLTTALAELDALPPAPAAAVAAWRTEAARRLQAEAALDQARAALQAG